MREGFGDHYRALKLDRKLKGVEDEDVSELLCNRVQILYQYNATQRIVS